MQDKLRSHFEKIIPLTDHEFDFIVSHFTTMRLKKNQFLIQENDYVYQDFWVAKGLLRAYSRDDNGKEHIIQFAKEDWWVSDYQAYFNQEKSTINLVCLEDTEVFCLTLENREKICAELHKVEHFFRKKSNMGYIALQRRILSLLNSTAKERYDQFLAQYPDLLQRVPKTLVASYLGVSRETLSRML